jgi:HAD superfamily phosphatase (TIGR01668 family)
MWKRLITPSLIVQHVRDISPGLLAERGIRAVVCDLDNTVVAYRSDAITDEVSAWLRELKAAGIGVCIASNTLRLSRLSRVAAAGGMLHVPGNAGKPGTHGLRCALALLGTAPEETAMVGDQVFTDIVAGNRLGLMTVLVNPLSPHEFFGTQYISRPAERLVLRGLLQRAK